MVHGSYIAFAQVCAYSTGEKVGDAPYSILPTMLHSRCLFTRPEVYRAWNVIFTAAEISSLSRAILTLPGPPSWSGLPLSTDYIKDSRRRLLPYPGPPSNLPPLSRVSTAGIVLHRLVAGWLWLTGDLRGRRRAASCNASPC